MKKHFLFSFLIALLVFSLAALAAPPPSAAEESVVVVEPTAVVSDQMVIERAVLIVNEDSAEETDVLVIEPVAIVTTESAVAATPAPAVANDKPENWFLVGAAFGVVEPIPYFLKNMADCKGIKCLNIFRIPVVAGKALLTGAGRVAGTSTLGLAGAYHRDFLTDGDLAKLPILPEVVGGFGLGLGVSVVSHSANFAYWMHHTLGMPGHSSRTAYEVAGATVGLGIGLVNAAIK